MPDAFQAEIQPVGPTFPTRMLAVTAGLSLIAGAAAVLDSRRSVSATRITIGDIAPAVATVEVLASSESSSTFEAVPAPDRSEIFLVFRAANRAFMQLDQSEELEALAHSSPKMTRGEGANDATYSAIARVHPDKVPAHVRAWLGKRVVVGASCEATVEGFAYVARLEGSPDYAGVDAGDATDWTARTVFEHGRKVFVAALSDCGGGYARDASLSRVVALTASVDVADAPLETRATELLFASAASQSLQPDWEQMRGELGDGEPRIWHEAGHVHTTTQVLRHPTTATTWVIAHARREDGCGGFNVNLIGIFRVTGAGSLEPVAVHNSSSLTSIDAVIDVEGDDSLELVGRDWLGIDRIITRADGVEVTASAVEFYGCPC